jgi:murein DD-endopeptidase MepM/ murein hydrolase activator NlpD
LRKANPSITGEHLDLGQEINLVALEPMINVVTTGERTAKEPLPYKVVIKTDRNLWRGREKVKTRGENGLREVTYKLVLKNGTEVSRDVLNEKVLKSATDQVVIRGSKYVVASRGGGGIIGWPIGGRITSPFGMRWGSMHTGIDIDGTTGQPVGAAAEGIVISTGWEGAYGKIVAIRHGNGLVTRYAHLSKIEVSVGQKVARGDLIGLIGTTGRSTGSHLHFEVISGGRFENPVKFLK